MSEKRFRGPNDEKMDLREFCQILQFSLLCMIRQYSNLFKTMSQQKSSVASCFSLKSETDLSSSALSMIMSRI